VRNETDCLLERSKLKAQQNLSLAVRVAVHPVSILLVDDNAGFLRILTNFLERLSQGEIVIVGTALGGREGLAKADALRPRVVIIDLAMPDLHGLAAIPQLRTILPEAGIIALSLLDSSSYREEALAVGANEFVSKARLDTDLIPAIRRLGDCEDCCHESVIGPGCFGVRSGHARTL
jgi:DNA-binding NarL/FixJ family response regulator